MTLACLALTGCMPQANGAVALPAGLPTAALFDCAEASVRRLHRDDPRWATRVTRRDLAAGVFETGDFAESNVIGYRLRLARNGGAPRAALSVRAAGPYFTDLGADGALSSLRSELGACTARVEQTR